MTEDARELPKVRTNIVLPEALLVRLKVAAAEDRTSVSAIVCALTESYLAERDAAQD